MQQMGKAARDSGAGAAPGPHLSRPHPVKKALWIELDEYEFSTAVFIGVQRQLSNLKVGRTDSYGATTQHGWELHIQGACGEAAVAKHINCYWSLGKLRADDVGSYQVRTRSRQSYDLILHPEDPDDAIFVLVVGQAPRFRICGWIAAAEGKHQEFWADPAGGRPAFFVPQNRLHPIETLPRPGQGRPEPQPQAHSAAAASKPQRPPVPPMALANPGEFPEETEHRSRHL